MQDIKIYVIFASQYSAKVLIGLDSRKILHSVEKVDIMPSKRKLPSGGLLVPEMTYRMGWIIFLADVYSVFSPVCYETVAKDMVWRSCGFIPPSFIPPVFVVRYSRILYFVRYISASGEVQIVPDSDAIFDVLDEKFLVPDFSEKFFPTADVREINTEVVRVLGSWVLYYNWIWPTGYKRSMQKAGVSGVPW